MSRSLLLNSNEALLIAGGDDKVIRIWDTRSGQQVREIRGEVGDNIYGAITAMALSPDDRWLAVGIFYPNNSAGGEKRGYLRLHDFASGKLIRILEGHRQVLHSLEFSSDGSMLLGGEGSDRNPEAIIWDTTSWQVKQAFKGHDDQIYGASFTRDGSQVITGSWDKSIRIWDIASGKMTQKIDNAHDGRIYNVVVPATSSQSLAISGGTDNRVKFWDTNSGKELRDIKMDRKVRQLAVNRDGTRLLVASVGRHDNAWIEVIDIASGKTLDRYEGHDRFTVAMTFSRDGETVYSSGGFRHEIDRWSARDGQRKQRIASVGLPVQAVGFSPDGNQVFWGNQELNWNGREFDPDKLAPLSRRIELNTLHNQLGIPQQLGKTQAVRAVHKQGKLSLERSRKSKGDLPNLLSIKQGSRTLGTIERDSRSGHLHTAYTLTPDLQYVVSGAEIGNLGLYDLKGKLVGDFKGHNDDITDVVVSPDGRLLVSGSRDQTFRLWNISNQELLLSFFISGDGEWIAWAPTGYYTSSPNGDRYIGWVINQGIAQNARYVLADQMKSRLYRPDIVHKIIASYSVKTAMETSPQADFSVAQVQEKKVIPVDFNIISPQPGLSTASDAVNLQVQVTENIQSDVQWAVTVNDRQVLNQIATRGLARTQPAGATITFPVMLDPGDNLIRVVANNNETEKELTIKVTRQVTAVAQKGISGDKLLIISVGVNQYDNMPEQSLRFAAADADALADKFIRQEGKNYDTVESIVLSDNSTNKPTRDNIVDALDSLADLGPNDTVILFLAGHGIVEDTTYYFLPRDASQADGDRWKKSTVIAWDEIQRAMQSSLGRRILLVDTCYSANAFNSRLIKDAEDSNIIVMSSTDSTTLAQEISSLGHGVFTYALVSGIDGEADSYKDGKVTMTELNAFVANAVPSITRNSQVPTLSVPGGFKDFVVVRL